MIGIVESPMFARAVILAVTMAAVSGPPSAQAATLNVTTTADTLDTSPGDGQCVTKGGLCSLRAAVQEANAVRGYDLIAVPAGIYRLTRHGPFEDASATGDLDLTSDLEILGAGAARTIIDGDLCPDATSTSCTLGSIGQDSDRVLHILGSKNTPKPKVQISAVTVQNGGGSFTSGGGIAVTSDASVKLVGAQVRLNRTRQLGGGIAISGAMSIDTTTIADNELPMGGGGATSSGGGILVFSGANLTLSESTVSGNRATRGGGIRNGGGFVQIQTSTISGNTAYARGGGIMNYGPMRITESTITGNTANVRPDGEDRRGGGIYHTGADSLWLSGSIVAMNGNGLYPGSTFYSPDCATVDGASITSYRYNLIGILNTSCMIMDFSGAGGLPYDQKGSESMPLNPRLEPLGANGGPTRTHALLVGSPAVDRGAPPAVRCLPGDQRGYVRPTDGNSDGTVRCDVGAFELRSRRR